MLQYKISLIRPEKNKAQEYFSLSYISNFEQARNFVYRYVKKLLY